MDANITVLVHSLFKGSRNPPVDVQILLRTVRGDWGIGTAYLHGGRMYFNFYRPGQAWLGEHKAAFTAWMLLPQLPSKTNDTDKITAVCGYVECQQKKFRFIPSTSVYVNAYTPVGDPADFYEMKPYGGRRLFHPIMKVEQGVVTACWDKKYSYERSRWEYKVSADLNKFLQAHNIAFVETEGLHFILPER